MPSINDLVSICLEELGPSNNFDNADADGIIQSDPDLDVNRIQVVKYSKGRQFYEKRLKSPTHRSNCDTDEFKLDQNRASL